MNLTDYLQRHNARLILLAEIDYETADPLRLADQPYITEPGDAPTNTLYAPVIADGGMPRLAQRLPDLWGGLAVGSWGDLALVSQAINHNGTLLDLVSYGLKGRSIRLKITGPRAIVPYSQAQIIFVGRIGDVRASSDGTIVLTLEDLTERLREIVLPPDRYDSALMGSNFPSQNHGRAKPMLLGHVRNITPVLIDQVAYTYQYDAYYGVGVVYYAFDNGVVVGKTDHGNGTFSLTAPPAGQITCDASVQVLFGGGATGDDWRSVGYLLATYAGISAYDYWLGDWSNDTGLYLTEQTTLADVLATFSRSMFGWGGFSATGRYQYQALEVPAAGGPVIGETKRLGDVSWRDIPQRFNRVPALVFRNWTRQEQPAGGVDLNLRAYLASDGGQQWVEDAADIAATGLRAAPRLDTLFFVFLTVDATLPHKRALAFWLAHRREVTLTVPMKAWDWTKGFGDSFTLADTPVDGDYLVVGFARTTADGEPAIQITGVG